MQFTSPDKKRYFIIAGEASGDLHASNLMRELKILEPTSEFAGFGGDLMVEQGLHLIKHYRELDFMGFIEVIKNLRTIFKNIDLCKASIAAYKPDVLILIDYPGFNLRIAPFAKELGIKVVYYISPQIWAWKQDRVHKIKKCVDRMMVILPFEKSFYKRFDMDVDFVGHPLLDAIENDSLIAADGDFKAKHQLDQRPIVALLPGSRKQEISAKLPVMLKMIQEFPEHQFVIAKAKSQSDEFFKEMCKGYKVTVVNNDTYSLLKQATAACVTSGTATLETALFEVPEVVCYKGSRISYHIAKRLIKVKYISLVNLIMDREVVKELIQEDFNAKNLKRELSRLLDPTMAGELKEKYKDLKQQLGGGGASTRAAEIVHTLG